MRYYIVQKGETLDLILQKFHLNRDVFLQLNGPDIVEKWKMGLKIKVGNEPLPKVEPGPNQPILTGPITNAVHELYQQNNSLAAMERHYICPHCKKIIVIPVPPMN